MKKINNYNFYKKAQASSGGNLYDYDWFAEEIFESKGPTFKVIDQKGDSEFDQGFRDEWDVGADSYFTSSTDSGTEHIEVDLSAIGTIKCPERWWSDQSIQDLESRLNKDLLDAPEYYNEAPPGNPNGLWETIGSYLNDFNKLYQPDITSSSCALSIGNTERINANELKVLLHVSAEVYGEGTMTEEDEGY